MKFVKAFTKTAGLPNWLHQSHKTLTPTKNMPAYSRKGVLEMWRRRLVKK